MTKSIPLTKAAVDNLRPPISQVQNRKGTYVLHPIEGMPGAYVKITDRGVRTFLYQYREPVTTAPDPENRRTRRVTIGKYGALTIDGAKKALQQIAARVALGEDPAGDAGRAQAAADEAKAKEAEEGKTINDLMDRYMNDYVRVELPPNSVRSIEQSEKWIRQQFGDKRILEIELGDINVGLRDVPRGSRNNVVAYVRRAWRWGRVNKVVPRQLVEPTEGYKRIPSVSRAQDVTNSEYARIGAAVDQMLQNNKNDPSRLLAIKFMALYGCRPSEAMRLKPTDESRERGYLVLKSTQEERLRGGAGHKTERRTGKPKIFIITPECEEILDQAAALRSLRKTQEYLFPRRWKKYEHNWYASTWESIRKKANVKHLSLTNFRSAFITVAHDELGLTLDHIAAVTQHSDARTIRAHYVQTRQSTAKSHLFDMHKLINSKWKDKPIAPVPDPDPEPQPVAPTSFS